MDWGMANRLGQLIQSDGHCMFLPIDHGYFQGPTRKLEEPGKTIEPLLPYADAVFATRGVVRSVTSITTPRLRKPADAVSCFCKTGMDVLVLGNSIVERRTDT